MAVRHYKCGGAYKTTSTYRLRSIRGLCESTTGDRIQVSDSIQAPDFSEVVSSAPEKMLESNGHFIRTRMIADQRATEIENLQEIIASQKQENNDLKVEIKTLK
jgi:hypothetical protein